MALGRSLVSENLLGQKVNGSWKTKYTSFHISDKGLNFLRDPDAILKLVPTQELRNEKKAAVGDSASGGFLIPAIHADVLKGNPAATELYERLMELRKEVAKEHPNRKLRHRPGTDRNTSGKCVEVIRVQ